MVNNCYLVPSPNRGQGAQINRSSRGQSSCNRSFESTKRAKEQVWAENKLLDPQDEGYELYNGPPTIEKIGRNSGSSQRTNPRTTAWNNLQPMSNKPFQHIDTRNNDTSSPVDPSSYIRPGHKTPPTGGQQPFSEIPSQFSHPASANHTNPNNSQISQISGGFQQTPNISIQLTAPSQPSPTFQQTFGDLRRGERGPESVYREQLMALRKEKLDERQKELMYDVIDKQGFVLDMMNVVNKHVDQCSKPPKAPSKNYNLVEPQYNLRPGLSTQNSIINPGDSSFNKKGFISEEEKQIEVLASGMAGLELGASKEILDTGYSRASRSQYSYSKSHQFSDSRSKSHSKKSKSPSKRPVGLSQPEPERLSVEQLPEPLEKGLQKSKEKKSLETQLFNNNRIKSVVEFDKNLIEKSETAHFNSPQKSSPSRDYFMVSKAELKKEGFLGKQVKQKLKQGAEKDFKKLCRQIWREKFNQQGEYPEKIKKDVESEEIMRQGGGHKSFTMYHPQKGWRGQNPTASISLGDASLHENTAPKVGITVKNPSKRVLKRHRSKSQQIDTSLESQKQKMVKFSTRTLKSKKSKNNTANGLRDLIAGEVVKQVVENLIVPTKTKKSSKKLEKPSKKPSCSLNRLESKLSAVDRKLDTLNFCLKNRRNDAFSSKDKLALQKIGGILRERAKSVDCQNRSIVTGGIFMGRKAARHISGLVSSQRQRYNRPPLTMPKKRIAIRGTITLSNK